MPLPNRLLAATDFSRPARLAVLRAARVAAATGARLDVVHVARPLSRSLMAWLRKEPEGKELLESARTQLEEVVAGAIDLGADARGHLVTGAPVATLEATCGRLKTGLVVLGAHGSRGLRDRVIGTTAERLVERLRCDMLVVRKRPSTVYRKVLVCVDTSAASAQALRCALALAPDAKVEVLHAYEPPLAGQFRSARLRELAAKHAADERERARETLRAFIADAGIDDDRLKLVLRTGHPPQVIERAASALQPDLIAVGHSTSPLVAPFVGSVAREVLRTCDSDILVAHG